MTVRGRYAKTHSGQITLFQATFGPAPLLSRLLELRASADYAKEPFTTPTETIARSLDETSGFVVRCRLIVERAQATGADEPDPPPDH